MVAVVLFECLLGFPSRLEEVCFTAYPLPVFSLYHHHSRCRHGFHRSSVICCDHDFFVVRSTCFIEWSRSLLIEDATTRSLIIIMLVSYVTTYFYLSPPFFFHVSLACERGKQSAGATSFVSDFCPRHLLFLGLHFSSFALCDLPFFLFIFVCLFRLFVPC